MKPHIAVSLLLSAIALGLMSWHLFDPGHVDGWVIGLLAIAFLPWLWPVIESVGFPGGSIKFRELKEQQEKQEHEIRTLQFLVAHFLTDHEKAHLRKIANREPFPVSGETPNPFFDEIRRLRALGFITQRGGRGVTSMRTEYGDVRDYFDIAESGRQYLELLDKTEYLTAADSSR